MKKCKLLLMAFTVTLSLTGCGLFEIKNSSGAPGEFFSQENAETVGNATDTGSLKQEAETGRADGVILPAQSPVATPLPTSTPTPTPTPAPEISLVMVGDILLHTPLAKSAKAEDGSYDFSAVFAQMKEDIQAADLALVNQEVIIGGAELGVSGYPAFNAPFELGDELVESGFDVICHATNHTMDKGKKGLLSCLAFWEENYPDITVLGIYGDEAASEEIYVYEQEGIRVAILNYTYGMNGIALPSDMPYAVDMLEKEKVAVDLQKASELADFVIVCPHWGTEYVLEQTSGQEKWAQFFAENGADLVLGTHPHVIEPIEWVGDTLVYYSLGNFVNWTSGTGAGVANRMVGGMAQVTITREESGEVAIKEYGVEPVVCHLEQGFGGVTVYPLSEYTTELAEKNEIVKQDAAFSLEYCKELVEKVFGETADMVP